MNVIIDGIIFTLQKYGGISVYFKELLKYSSKISFAGSVLIDGFNSKTPIDDFGNFELVFRKPRLFERYRFCRLPSVHAVFHSSYYRIPSERKVPSVVTVHDFVYERHKKGLPKSVHTFQKNAAINSAQSIICVSKATKDDLLEYFGDLKDKTVHVIHNGVSDKFFPIYEKSSQIPYVLFVGHRAGYKNFKLVRDSLVHLPDIYLYCVGGGAFSANEFEHLSSDIVDRIKHFDYVDDSKLNLLYNNAICLVYPSLYEGFGIPVIEAMKAGCPVISVNCKAVLEVGRDALLVVDENDPRSLAAEIINISTSSRVNFINRGIKVSEEFSWHKTHAQTFEIYKSLV